MGDLEVLWSCVKRDSCYNAAELDIWRVCVTVEKRQWDE
jgi:hypothetical protein